METRNRLIAAALRFAAAERGGLDDSNAEQELANASATLDEAVVRYFHDELCEEDVPADAEEE